MAQVRTTMREERIREPARFYGQMLEEGAVQNV